MFGKVKKWLGIEGVKIALEIPEQVQKSSGVVYGKVLLSSQNTQTVTHIELRLMERYARGRGEHKLIDEYKLGEIKLDKAVEVPAEQIIAIDFDLPFSIAHSEMDDLEDRNVFTRMFAKTAKRLYGVDSSFRLEAEAEVNGTALNPHIKQAINII